MRRATPRHRRLRRITSLTLVAGVLLALAPQLASAAPAPPTNLAGVAGSGGVSLMWTPSTSMTASGYWIYRNGVIIGSVSGATAGAYLDATVTSATTYTYYVVSTDWYGVQSTPSNSLTVKTAGASDTALPSTPAGLSASPGNTTVSLSWLAATDNVGVTGYRVYRNGVLVGSPSGTSFGDSGLTNGTSYAYTVRAADAAGNLSAASGSATAAPFAPADTSAPTTPTSLTATAGNAQVALSWGASSDNLGVSGYRVYRNGTLVGSPAGTSYTDTGLTNGTTYAYTVKAIDASGNLSAGTAVANAAPAAPAAAPATPPAAAPASGPAVSCTKYAATDGVDTNAGTLAAPFRTPQRLLDSLAAGQTGCLRAGTYIQYELRATHSGVAGSPITLASSPGERAAILTNTDIYVPDAYSYVSFVNLNLGPNPASTTLQAVTIQDFGENTSWIGNDVTGAGLKTCFEIGSAGWGVAHNTLIQGNRIHDCGARADGNQDHAIYVSQSIGATITGNLIWNAAAYAVQLYPNADNSSVTHNVIDGSGYGGVIFSSDQAAGTGRVSDSNDVSYNVITGGTRLGVQAWWGPSGVGTGNTATHNCLYGNAGGDFGGGSDLAAVTLSANVNANPLFVNAAAHDYRLGAGSGCLAVVGTDTAATLP